MNQMLNGRPHPGPRLAIVGECPHGCGINLGNPDGLPDGPLPGQVMEVSANTEVEAVSCPECAGLVLVRPQADGTVALSTP